MNSLLVYMVINTVTMTCEWKFTFFKAIFVNNYGSEEFEKRFTRDVYIRTIYLLNMYKNLKESKRFYHYLWYENYSLGIKDYKVSKDTIYIENLTDTVIIKEIFDKKFKLKISNFKKFEKEPFYVFSLHLAMYPLNKYLEGLQFIDTLYLSEYDREFLFIYTEGGFATPLGFLQEETDGYFHLYRGFYLTRKNVERAKEIWKEKFNKVSIVSFPLNYKFLKKYFSF